MFEPAELLILIIYGISFTISSATGFGGMLLFFGIASFFDLDIKLLMFLVSLGEFCKATFSGYLFRKSIPWKTVKKILIFSIPLVILGASITYITPSKYIKNIVGLFILFYLSSMVIQKPNKNWEVPNWIFILLSSCWGFISGLVGAGGPIIIALLNSLKLTKKSFVATLQILFISSSLFKIPLYYRIESPYSNNLKLILSIIITAFIAAYFGKQLNNKFSEKLFKKFVLGLLLINGLKMVFF